MTTTANIGLITGIADHLDQVVQTESLDLTASPSDPGDERAAACETDASGSAPGDTTAAALSDAGVLSSQKEEAGAAASGTDAEQGETHEGSEAPLAAPAASGGGNGSRSAGPSGAWGTVLIPAGLTQRQLRATLKVELKAAIKARDFAKAEALEEALSKIEERMERRASRDSLLRKANRENPYDPRLLDLYEDWTIRQILEKYMKAIRFDFSGYGLVGGMAGLLANAAADVGHPVEVEVLEAQTKAVCWKVKERIHGLGTEFVTDANQVLRLVAEIVKEGRIPEEKWLRRHPLPTPDAWGEEFEADWNSWLQTQEVK